MILRGQRSLKYSVASTWVKGFLEPAYLNSEAHMNRSSGTSQVLISGLGVKSPSLTCPCSLPGWMLTQSLGDVVAFTSLSLEIPNRSVGEDESHQKNFHQSQETGHLVSLEQETFIWSFCAFMPFCAPLASDLSTPAPCPWQEAPCL